MIYSATVNGSPIDLPSSFDLNISIHSAHFDENIRIGDFNMDVSLPITSANQKAFDFTDQLEVIEQPRVFENVKFYESGKLVLSGILTVFEISKTEDSNHTYITDFFTNLLPFNLNETQLSELLSKEVYLGETPQQIAQAAYLLNQLNSSPDGISSATLKFFPTLGRDFYGDNNSDWVRSSSKWDKEQEYEDGDVVEFRHPITDYSNSVTPFQIKYSISLVFFRALQDAAPGESPASAPSKWIPISEGVFNTQFDETLLVNDSFDKQWETINRFAILPYIQIHDIIRDLAKNLGYTVDGSYMDDDIERKAYYQSNLALDKDGGPINYVHVGATNTALPWEWALQPFIFPLDTGVYQDINDHYDPLTGIYTAAEQGDHRIELNLTVTVAGGAHPSTTFAIRKNGQFLDAVSTSGSDPDTVNLTLTIIDSLSATTELHLAITVGGTGGGVGTQTLDRGEMKITNLKTDFVNVFDTTVRYKDHAPNITAGEFLSSLSQWPNLTVTFNPLNKVLSLDYADDIYLVQPDIELKSLQTSKHKIVKRKEASYEFNYPNTQNFEIPTGFEELPAANAVADLPPPNESAKYIFVKNENAYYFTKEYDFNNGGYLIWEFGGYAWNKFKANLQGDIQSIIPQLSPVPIRRYMHVGLEILAPIIEGPGRSSMFNSSGTRPSLFICYDSENENVYSSPYRAAIVVPYTQDGTQLVHADMKWKTIYAARWTRTIASLINMVTLEGPFTVFPWKTPTQLLSKLHLLNNVPVLPVKIDINIGQSSLQILQLRKIQTFNVESKIIPLETAKINNSSPGSGPKSSGSGAKGNSGGPGTIPIVFPIQLPAPRLKLSDKQTIIGVGGTGVSGYPLKTAPINIQNAPVISTTNLTRAHFDLGIFLEFVAYRKRPPNSFRGIPKKSAFMIPPPWDATAQVNPLEETILSRFGKTIPNRGGHKSNREGFPYPYDSINHIEVDQNLSDLNAWECLQYKIVSKQVNWKDENGLNDSAYWYVPYTNRRSKARSGFKYGTYAPMYFKFRYIYWDDIESQFIEGPFCETICLAYSVHPFHLIPDVGNALHEGQTDLYFKCTLGTKLP
jgi:hypothetical protein